MSNSNKKQKLIQTPQTEYHPIVTLDLLWQDDPKAAVCYVIKQMVSQYQEINDLKNYLAEHISIDLPLEVLSQLATVFVGCADYTEDYERVRALIKKKMC